MLHSINEHKLAMEINVEIIDRIGINICIYFYPTPIAAAADLPDSIAFANTVRRVNI